jgi:predicted ribosome quality control (RQC) complex YloA/Tae2 family protein
MNEATLQIITAELRDKLVGQKFGKIFVLGPTRFAVDFIGDGGAYLLISANPSEPRLFLIKRTLKSLSKASKTPDNFTAVLRKLLSHAELAEIIKVPEERIVKFVFESRDDAGLDLKYSLIVQLTGRSSNVFLLDSDGIIVAALRKTFGDGQNKDDRYAPPPSSEQQTRQKQVAFKQGGFGSLSEALDEYYLDRDEMELFRRQADSARALIRADLKKRRRLQKRLSGDLLGHGEPDKWKRLGDLVNANINTAVRHENTVVVIDYFDEKLPEIELEVDKNLSLSDTAEKYFKKYSKARTAQKEIKRRLLEVKSEIEALETRLESLELVIDSNDMDGLTQYLPKQKKEPKRAKHSKGQQISKYAREYVSSDGYSILVGKRSKDNDHLTFRIARSLDVWLHAADYPGSHVVIKRKGREDIPQSTIIEAARLAAFYSKAKNEGKAAVRYTERKFVNKPKGSAPGLVSLASFRTILIAPGMPDFQNQS